MMHRTGRNSIPVRDGHPMLQGHRVVEALFLQEHGVVEDHCLQEHSVVEETQREQLALESDGVQLEMPADGGQHRRARGDAQHVDAEHGWGPVGLEANAGEQMEIRLPRTSIIAQAPAREEGESHLPLHLRYLGWCPVCVQAAGIHDPLRSSSSQPSEAIGTTISLDSCFFYKNGELRHASGQHDMPTILIVHDDSVDGTWAMMVMSKGMRGGGRVGLATIGLRWAHSRSNNPQARSGGVRGGVEEGSGGKKECQNDLGRVASASVENDSAG